MTDTKMVLQVLKAAIGFLPEDAHPRQRTALEIAISTIDALTADNSKLKCQIEELESEYTAFRESVYREQS